MAAMCKLGLIDINEASGKCCPAAVLGTRPWSKDGSGDGHQFIGKDLYSHDVRIPMMGWMSIKHIHPMF